MALVAVTGFVAAGGRVVPAGAHVDEDDPVVAGREHLFAPLVERGGVEQATAAPGELRNSRRGRPAGRRG